MKVEIYTVQGGTVYTLGMGTALLAAPVMADGSIPALSSEEHEDWYEVDFGCISDKEKEDCQDIHYALSQFLPPSA